MYQEIVNTIREKELKILKEKYMGIEKNKEKFLQKELEKIESRNRKEFKEIFKTKPGYIIINRVNLSNTLYFDIKKDSIDIHILNYRYDMFTFNLSLDFDIDKITNKLLQIFDYNNLNRKLKLQPLIRLENIKRISTLYNKIPDFDFSTELENYFSQLPKKNNLSNNIVSGFAHTLSPLSLEILLKNKNNFISTVWKYYKSEKRGIYATLKSLKCVIPISRAYNHDPVLIFSKELANDFGYYINFNDNFGVPDRKTIYKGQEFKIGKKTYSAVEKANIEICKKEMEKRDDNEIVFTTEKINMNKYLKEIIFISKEMFDIFKNMKGLRFKNKMRLIDIFDY